MGAGDGAQRPHGAGPRRRTGWSGWSTCTRSRPPSWRATPAAPGFERVRVSGEELAASLFGWVNRTLEATAEPAEVP